MSRTRSLACFNTENTVLQEQALEAGRFTLIYEYENGDLPSPEQIAGHVLGVEIIPGDVRLKRVGSCLYRLIGPEIARFEDPEHYLTTLERFGCRDDIYDIMHKQDAQRP